MKTPFHLIWIYGVVLGLTFAGVVTACATLTDPPSNWPKAPTCAQEPDQDGCPGAPGDGHQPIDITAMKARDAGR